MEKNFPLFLANVLNPSNDGQSLHDTIGDPGGATAYGVTLGALSDYLKRPATISDLAALKPHSDIIFAIYKMDFWDQMHGDALPTGVDLMVADLAVVDGPVASARVLQRTVGVAEDGHIGPATLAAVAAMDVMRLIARLAVSQGLYDGGLHDAPEFGKGWSRRIADNAYMAVKAQMTEISSEKQGVST